MYKITCHACKFTSDFYMSEDPNCKNCNLQLAFKVNCNTCKIVFFDKTMINRLVYECYKCRRMPNCKKCHLVHVLKCGDTCLKCEGAIIERDKINKVRNKLFTHLLESDLVYPDLMVDIIYSVTNEEHDGYCSEADNITTENYFIKKRLHLLNEIKLTDIDNFNTINIDNKTLQRYYSIRLQPCSHGYGGNCGTGNNPEIIKAVVIGPNNSKDDNYGYNLNDNDNYDYNYDL